MSDRGERAGLPGAGARLGRGGAAAAGEDGARADRGEAGPTGPHVRGAGPGGVALAGAGLVVLSLLLGLVHDRRTEPQRLLQADAFVYSRIAWNLHLFGAYSADVPDPPGRAPTTRSDIRPGYPLFLVPFVVGAPSVEVFVGRVKRAQWLLASLVPLLAFLLARRALPVAWAFGAGVLTALSPHLVAIRELVLTETLFTVLLVSSLLLVGTAWRRGGPGAGAVAGLALGLLQLVREIAAPLALLLAPLLLLDPENGRPRPSRRRRRATGGLLFGFALVWVPMVLATGGLGRRGEAWAHLVEGSSVGLALERDPALRSPEHLRARQEPGFGARYLLSRFAESPVGTVVWYATKPLFLFRWDNLYVGGAYQYPMSRRGFEEGGLLGTVHDGMRLLHGPLVLLAAGGVLLLARRARRGTLGAADAVLLPTGVVIAYHVGLLTLLLPIPRYGIPLRPLICVLGLFAAVQAVEAWRGGAPAVEVRGTVREESGRP